MQYFVGMYHYIWKYTQWRCSEPQYSARYITTDNTKFRILEAGYKHSSHWLNKINLTRNMDKPPVHTAPEMDRRSAHSMKLTPPPCIWRQYVRQQCHYHLPVPDDNSLRTHLDNIKTNQQMMRM